MMDALERWMVMKLLGSTYLAAKKTSEGQSALGSSESSSLFQSVSAMRDAIEMVFPVSVFEKTEHRQSVFNKTVQRRFLDRKLLDRLDDNEMMFKKRISPTT